MNEARSQILQYLTHERDDAVWQVAYAINRTAQVLRSDLETKTAIVRRWNNIRTRNEELRDAAAEALDILRREWTDT